MGAIWEVVNVHDGHISDSACRRSASWNDTCSTFDSDFTWSCLLLSASM